MIQIAIVEDEVEIRKALSDDLLRYAGVHGHSFKITEYADGADIVEDFHGQYDVIFLDIQMPGLDGMKTAKQIRESDQDVELLFVTNLSHRAPDGYEVDARGFLIKPINYAILSRYLDHIMQAVSRKKDAYLVLTNSREMQRISLRTIHYIESMGHYIKVHTQQGETIALSSMKTVEQQLAGQPFFRCSNSCIVNLEKVDSITHTQVIVGGMTLAISRSRKKGLIEALNRYYSGIV